MGVEMDQYIITLLKSNSTTAVVHVVNDNAKGLGKESSFHRSQEPAEDRSCSDLTTFDPADIDMDTRFNESLDTLVAGDIHGLDSRWEMGKSDESSCLPTLPTRRIQSTRNVGLPPMMPSRPQDDQKHHDFQHPFSKPHKYRSYPNQKRWSSPSRRYPQSLRTFPIEGEPSCIPRRSRPRSTLDIIDQALKHTDIPESPNTSPMLGPPKQQQRSKGDHSNHRSSLLSHLEPSQTQRHKVVRRTTKDLGQQFGKKLGGLVF